MTSTTTTEHRLPDARPPLLCARGIAKTFGSTVALHGVDVDVHAGEVLGVMGPSGSGKSTLLHCLAAILPPSSGAVLLDGTPIQALREEARSKLRRTRFGFVFQHGQLLPELPAEENVALPLMLAGARRQQALARARAWFAPLGIAGLEGRRPGELSGGQAQRVAIARALVTEPSAVFADEPTGALDQTTGHQVLSLLTRTCREAGRALVVVTHDAHVASFADRLLHVRDGRVVDKTRRPL
ncbi:MAG TPA: ABC transporter ATP-binding protein [Actinomycetales bacterium]|nr:ABC transporter ATP-binding protein [Actinomycetales bacterium]